MITITALSIYPVKSMKGTSLQSSDVDLIGLKGDRRWIVVDANGKFKTIREFAEMAQIEARSQDGALQLHHPQHGSVSVPVPDAAAPTQKVTVWRSDAIGSCANEESSRFLSSLFGTTLKLLYLRDEKSRGVNPKNSKPDDHVSFADGYPILLTSESSLQDLEKRAGIELSMRRFRTNIVLKGAAPWAEDTWKRIEIGGIQFRIAKPCGRCVVTTLEPDTGEKHADNEPLATLRKFHRASDGEIIFGQNIIPDGTGQIAVGDEVKVLEVGESNLL